MHPIHFEFVGTPPSSSSCNHFRLFELLDEFPITYRHTILSPAYLRFKFKWRDESERSLSKDELYQSFKNEFERSVIADSFEEEEDVEEEEETQRWLDGLDEQARQEMRDLQDEEDEQEIEWRGAYAVYGLICFVLAEALSSSERDVYEQFRSRQSDQVTQFEKAREGDEASRQEAMEWSVKAISHLELILDVQHHRRVAYSHFCKEVVEPLLKG